MTPTGAPAHKPCFELCLWDDRFSWEYLQAPNSCHSHLSWAERACVCMCAHNSECLSVHADYHCVSESVSYTHRRQNTDGSAWGDGEHFPGSHTCGSSSKCTRHTGQKLNICRGSTPEVPEQGTVSGSPAQKCTVSSVVHVSYLLSLLHECLLTSSPLPAHSPLLLPFFLAAVEVTFINGKFMCMTALKPELWLPHLWRLSVNSCNHQSAKYLPLSSRQCSTRWLKSNLWD